ncbi:hypothetical protein CEP48_06450 [Mergibacter septicus]|uniref:Uncharacterized protein n=1 Tax=Mergibacter septicus TaxID=221402 RepID=A0A8D4J044_9PAST|nr:OmpH family outer membrane protein [Mergibacter septicus]AWX15839.1 hypothetical protein CEP47_06450 [Mergibacter septicus]QDJ15092.1 hypothetical protein CEP48_06450 [Mergibacter septicus]UTU47484.1 OmpH family outer membrane protein [Mergibacter septicus]WMR95335.1 OmpH family outer membrane protein [Mergibacter septicus]
MKKVFKTAALTLALMGATAFAQADEKIALVNGDLLIQQLITSENVGQKIDNEFKSEIEKVQAQQKTLVTKAEALEKDRKKLKAADLKKREEELNKLQADYVRAANELQQKVQVRQNQELERVTQEAQEALNKVAKEKGYTIVFKTEAAAYAVDGKDITQDVLKVLIKLTPAKK